MTSQSPGGGSSAVAASAHAACARFRATDPLIVGRTRRQTAHDVGFADDSGRIPEARWMRAMTFERLVRDTVFASEVATTTVGRLGLARPTEVHTVHARVSLDTTAQLLQSAHDRTSGGAATLIHGLAIPFVGFEETPSSAVKPDFAVVAPRTDADGSWLIVGDAKDYERVRSRIEDTRLLKGFLQVALGTESAQAWTRLPPGMSVHAYGVLAAPRNAFLQPEALVELLDDHRAEVRMRVAERREEARDAEYEKALSLTEYVAHLEATFDPATCPTCTLFHYCRDRLRTSNDPPRDLLVELGVPPEVRPHVRGLLDGSGPTDAAPASVVAAIRATLQGVGESTGQRRVDQAGQPGTVNVVVAKSDAAALGLHGIAVQRVTGGGRGPWEITRFDDPQAEPARRGAMRVLGKALTAAIADRRKTGGDTPSPVHLVVPDAATADVLASIADNLAGVELSRLRWQRDKEMGRPALTFNGEPAAIPPRLSESDRTAVSFLLEEDRARGFTLRSPIVDVREVLARHVVAGGPAVASQRLDYLVRWGESETVRHREFADEIEDESRTPGARLTNGRSDAIHRALTGSRRRKAGDPPADPEQYTALIDDELTYKAAVLERALDVLAKVPDSALREVHRAIEGNAQEVWRRRLRLHASDLVRFGRTYRHWRNALVPGLEADTRCERQLLALANPQVADDLATDPGVRELAVATVIDTEPLVVDVGSRRIGDGSRIVLLHRGDAACVEDPTVGLTAQKGSFKFSGLSIGPLAAVADGTRRRFTWAPATVPGVEVGDRLLVAEFAWFCGLTKNTHLAVDRPGQDSTSAPKPGCTEGSYADDPADHQWCCRPHEDAEAHWSDELAARRDRGELNPQVWPPVIDADAFEVSPSDAPTGDATDAAPETVPDDVTIDDLE